MQQCPFTREYCASKKVTSARKRIGIKELSKREAGEYRERIHDTLRDCLPLRQISSDRSPVYNAPTWLHDTHSPAYSLPLSSQLTSIYVTKFTWRDSAYNLRDSENKLNVLNVPLPRTNYYRNSFSYNGATLWNSLPCDIRT